MQGLLDKQPAWLICVIIGLIGVLQVMKYKDLDLPGKVVYWTVLAFFWITILSMAKNLFLS